MSCLEELPNEVILKTFAYLNKLDLGRCARVSKRFQAISQNESLWQKVNPNIFCQVSSKFIDYAIENGCKYLSLQGANLDGNLYLPEVTQLKYLNLSYCKANPGVLEDLTISCHHLEKLSLQDFKINPIFLKCLIQNGQTLRVLDLSWCTGFTVESIKLITTYCTKLKDVNFYYTNLEPDSIKYLCNNLTSEVENLSLGYLESVRDDHIKDLAFRCNKIRELDLRDTSITNISTIIDTMNLLKIGVTIDFRELRRIKSMKSIKVLYCNILSDAEVEILKEQNPSLEISKEDFNIAWPDQCYHYLDGFWDIQVKQENIRFELKNESNPLTGESYQYNI